MHDTLAVCAAKRVSNLSRDSQCIRGRQLTLTAKPVPQALALYEWHGVPQVARGLPGSWTGRICGCWKRAASRFLLEPLRPDARAKFRMERLERYRPIVLEVAAT